MLSQIGVTCDTHTVDGVRYYVTVGTGEHSTALGCAAFAYTADDVDALDWDGITSYQEFCDATDPQCDRELAITLAARCELRLLTPGCCMPVLSDAEYGLVRAAVDSFRETAP